MCDERLALARPDGVGSAPSPGRKCYEVGVVVGLCWASL